jgi:hypothetical protein
MSRLRTLAFLVPFVLGAGCGDRDRAQPRDTTTPGTAPSQPVGGNTQGDPARPGGGGATGANRSRDVPGPSGTAAVESGARDRTHTADAGTR